MSFEQLSTNYKTFRELFTKQEQAIQEIATQLPSLVGGSIETLRGIIKKNGNIKRGELGLLLITSLLLTSGCGTADNPVFKPALATATPITAQAIETPTPLIQATPTETLTKLPNLTNTPTEVVSPTPTKLPNTPTPVPSPTAEPSPTPTGLDIKPYPAPTPTTTTEKYFIYDMDSQGNLAIRSKDGIQAYFPAGRDLQLLAEYTDSKGNVYKQFHFSNPLVPNGWLLVKSAVEPTPVAPVQPHSHEPLLTLDRPGRQATSVKPAMGPEIVYWNEAQYLGPKELPFIGKNYAAKVESINLEENSFIANFGGGKKVKILWRGDNTQDNLSCNLVRFNPSYSETVEGATVGGDIKEGDIIFFDISDILPAINQIDPNKNNVPISTQYAAVLQK